MGLMKVSTIQGFYEGEMRSHVPSKRHKTKLSYITSTEAIDYSR